MKDVKISYCNNRIVIENYNSIKQLLNNLIIVDEYIIEGNDLMIKKMDEYYIIIIGNVVNIKIRSDLN